MTGFNGYESILPRYPLCARCLDRNLASLAMMVCHPAVRDLPPPVDYTRLVPLCVACSYETDAEEVETYRGRTIQLADGTELGIGSLLPPLRSCLYDTRPEVVGPMIAAAQLRLDACKPPGTPRIDS